jgi:hypothetical protein
MSGDRDGAEIPNEALDDLAQYFDRTDAGALEWHEAEDLVIERPEPVDRHGSPRVRSPHSLHGGGGWTCRLP